MITLTTLSDALYPIGVVGVSVPDWNDKATWLIWYEGSQAIQATADLKAAPIVAAFDIDSAIPVPTISKAQALLYLLSIGKTEADVDAEIAKLEPSARAVAQIEWKHRQPFHHDHPLFIALGPLLGINDMEAAFRMAATL